MIRTSVIFLAALLVWGASPARANEGLKLELSGYFIGAAAFVDQKLDLGRRNTGFASDSEVHFDGAFTFENGLTLGVHGEGKLEEDIGGQPRTGGRFTSENGADFIQETFIFLEGFFGRIEFGKQDGVAEQLGFIAPTLFAGTTVNDPELDATGFNTINTRNSVNRGRDDFSRRLIYISPRIIGLQAGISFAPDSDAATPGSLSVVQGSDFDARSDQGVFDHEEIIELGVNYVHAFDQIIVGVSGTYLRAEDQGCASVPALCPILKDYEAWNVGANISFGGITIGGSYVDDNLGRHTADYHAWEIGAVYETQFWGFMLAYGRDEVEGLGGQDTMAVQGGINYQLARGITLGTGLQYIEADQVGGLALIGGGVSGPSVLNDDATIVFLETMVSF